MKAVVVGGGKVGYYLVKTLKDKKFDITLIEQDMNACEKIAQNFDIEVINGDGTDLEVLKEAGTDNAELVAAVTGKDAENFVICQVAKINFNIEKTVARINNPKNREIFKALGVRDTVCSTEVIANIIDSELSNDKLRIVQTLDKGEIVLVEGKISRKSSWKNRQLANIDIPKGCVVVSIFRNDIVVYPSGGIDIKEDDKLLMAIPSYLKNEIENLI